jgi:hypothetical protein
MCTQQRKQSGDHGRKVRTRSAATAFDVAQELQVPVPPGKKGNGVTGMRTRRQVFQVAVITRQKHEGCPLVRVCQDSLEKTIEELKHFYGLRHALRMSGVVRLPVFKENQRMVLGQPHEAAPCVHGIDDGKRGMPEGVPSLSGNIGGDRISFLKIMEPPQRNAGVEAGECGDS